MFTYFAKKNKILNFTYSTNIHIYNELSNKCKLLKKNVYSNIPQFK